MQEMVEEVELEPYATLMKAIRADYKKEPK